MLGSAPRRRWRLLFDIEQDGFRMVATMGDQLRGANHHRRRRATGAQLGRAQPITGQPMLERG